MELCIKSRSSQGDDLREFADMYAKVTGFSEADMEQFLVKQLGEVKGKALMRHLRKEKKRITISEVTEKRIVTALMPSLLFRCFFLFRLI